MRRIAACALVTLVVLILFGVPVPATAGDKPFATGLMSYSGSVTVTTGCRITNVGKKSVIVTSTAIQNYNGTTVPTSFDNCVGTPLAAGGVCQFFGSAGVYGGGIAMVKGSTKNLRGNCGLFDSSATVQVLSMQ